MIEFALLLPFLVLILIGIMEYGWALSTNLDIRHGAREAARLAAVDADSSAGMAATVCNAMSFSDPNTSVTFAGPGVVGGDAGVTVQQNPYQSLTNFGIPLPASLETTVTIRIEQDSGWAAGTFTCP